MSSRFHNKWHRHNHHTRRSTDPKFPDSSYDPIASPDAPFQGDFVVQGVLSAQGGTFTGPLTANINFPAGSVATYNTPVQTTGEFLLIQVNNTTRLIRLYAPGNP